MSEAQRKAPEEQAERRQEAPRPQFSPPPAQQQDIRQVGAATDQRVQQALDHGARLEGRLPNPDLEQRAQNLTDWATQVRGLRVGDHEYSAQADIIVQTANRALQTGDGALMDKALGQAMLLGIGVNAQWRGDTSGSPDGRAISESIQRGWSMFGTDQGTERLSYSVAGARTLEDNPQVFNSPENQDAKNGILRAIGRLADPSVSMRPDEVRSAYQAIQQNAAIAAIRAGGNELMRDMAAQLQVVLASDTAREKLKDQVDKLIDSLGSAMAKLSDSKKDKEEKDKAVSELGEKAEKLAAAALESALAEAGAPPELIAALKGSGKMLDSKAAALRERGRQLLQLGITYLRNKSLFADKDLLDKLTSTARIIAEGKDRQKAADSLASLQKDMGKALDAIAKSRSGKLATLEQASKTLQGMLKGLENDKRLAASVKGLIGSVQDAVARLRSGGTIAPEFLKNLDETMKGLKGSIGGFLKLPNKTAEEKQDRDEAGGLLANALESSMKGPRSEVTKLLQFISGEYRNATDPQYKSLLARLSAALGGGKMKPDEARGQLSDRFVKEGEAAEGMLRKVSPKLADAFASIIKPLKDGKADLGILAKAKKALGIASFIKGKVLPGKDGKVKDGVLSLAQKALSSLKGDNLRGSDEAMGFADQLLSAPEDKAAEALDSFQSSMDKLDAKAMGVLRYDRSAMLELLPSLPKELQERLGKMLDAAKGLLEGGSDSDAVAALLGRLDQMKKMAEELRGIEDPQMKGDLATIYAAALDALESGQGGLFQSLMLAAKELKENGGFGKDAQSYRKSIMTCCKGISDPAKASEAAGQLLAAIGQSLLKKLDGGRKGQDADVLEQLDIISAGLRPDSISVSSLERARSALDTLKSMDSHLGKAYAGKLDADDRITLRGIYLRSLAQDDPAVSGAQKFLAEKFAEGEDEGRRKDIEAISSRVEQDPQAMPDIETFIQVNDQSAVIRKTISALPKGKEADSLAKIADELDAARGKIARGTELASKDEADSRLGQLKQLYAQGGEIKDKVDSLAADLLSKSDGAMSPDDALGEAMAYVARSTAEVGAKERLGSLISLSQMISKAGPNPAGGLSSTLDLALAALLRNDMEKGTVLTQAAAAQLENPAESGKIGEIAIDCDNGSLSLDTGMFIISLHSGDAIRSRAKILDKGMLANSKAYLSLAEMAARNGDVSGAKAIADMALTYSTLSSISDKSLDPDGKKMRSGTLASIEAALGDYRKLPDADFGSLAADGKSAESLGIAAPAAIAAFTKKPLKEALGPDGFQKLQSDLAGWSAASLLLSHSSGFEGLLGRDASSARYIDAQWDSERARLLDKADQQRKAGNQLLAEYYQNEADIADRSFVKESISQAKSILSRAASELEDSRKLASDADSLMDQARAARDSGRPDDASALESKAREKRGKSETLRQDSELLLASLSGIDKGLTELDRSVRRINSVNRERGRFEIKRAVRTDIALGLGRDADSLGNMTGELTPEGAQGLVGQAEGALETGKREVDIQESIMRTRDAGIASAKATLHDYNIQKSVELISGLEDRVVGGDPDAKKVVMEGVEKDAKEGNVVALRDCYFQLADKEQIAVGFTDADGSFKTAFDPVENEKKYKAVVGLYYSENFAAAGALSRSTRFDFESRGQIATIFLQARRLENQYAAAMGPPKGPFQKAINSWSSRELLKQMINRLPADKRGDLMDKLESFDRGSGGNEGREEMYEALTRDPDSLTGRAEQDIINGRMGFFHENALISGVVEARKLAQSGDIGGAEALFADKKAEVEKQTAMQEYDNERISFDRLNYEYRVRAGRTKDIYLDVPGEAGEYEDGSVKKAALDAKRNAERINHDLESPVDELKDGLLLRAKENDAASKRNLDARDAAGRLGGKIRVDEGVIGSLVASMPSSAKEIHDMYDDAGKTQDPAARAEKMQAVWTTICENHPEALVYAADRAAQDPSFNPDEVVELKALAGGLLVRSLNLEWDTTIEPMATRRIRRGADFLQKKAGTKDEDDKRKLDELAKISLEGGSVLAREGYGWFKDPDRAKSIIKNDRYVDEEDFKLVFKKSDFDQYTKDHTASELGEMKSELELWLSGIRVNDGKVEKVRLSPAEYERVSKSYQAFLMMEDELRSNAGVGREDQQREHMAHVFGRAYEFHRSAETLVMRPESVPRPDAIAQADKLFDAQGIYTDPKGRMKDVDLQTKIYRDAMRDWQAGVDLGLGALKLVGMGVAFAVGGPAAWVAGGIGAVEGFMGAADYYERCGGWDMMSTGEAGFFIFQLGMAAGSAAAPVMGSLAEARAAESVAAGLVEGAESAVPGALETSALWLGRGMVAGGLVQGGIGIYNYSDMVSSGQMPLWAAIMHGGIDIFQSGVQPGLHAIRGARAGSSGLPTVRSKALQIGEMIFFGTPLDNAHEIRISYEEGLNRKAVEKEFSQLPPMEKQSFAGYISENGLSPSRQLDLFVRYDEARKVNPDIAVKDFLAINDRFTDAVHPNASFGDYVKNDMLRRSGTLDAEEMKARNTASKEARSEYESGTPIPRMEYKADEMERQAARLPPERRGEAVGLLRKAEAYRTEARRRQNEIDAGLRDSFSKRLDAVSAGGGVMLAPKMARPTEAYSQKSSAVAVELAVAADQVIRGRTDLGSGASRAVANLKKRGIEMDRGAVLDALSRLSQDKEFIGGGELAESTRGEDRASADIEAGRTAQIERSLKIVSSMEGMEPPAKINQPPQAAAMAGQGQAVAASSSQGETPAPPAQGKPPQPKAPDGAVPSGFSPTPLAGGGNPPAPPPVNPPPTGFSPTPLAGGGAGKPPEPPRPAQASPQQSPQPGGGKRAESPAEIRARAIASKANFDSAAKELEAKFGPDAVRKFNPADPADQIYGFARASMEKSVNGETLRPNEEAAVMFVVFKKMEAEEAAKLTPSQAKDRFMKSMANQENIAELARRIANGDKDAERSLADLPPEMGAAIRSISSDKAFAAAAAMDDASFAASWPKIYASRSRLRESFDATRRALAPSREEIIGVYRGTPDFQQRMETMRAFAALKPEDQQAVIETLRKEGRGIYTVQLTELASLCGPDGLALELKFGLKPGELAQAYSQGFGFFEGRMAIAQKLNIQADPIDSYAFGIITSGKLLQNLEGIYPGFTKIELKDIGGGATGAYKLKVTDGAGDHVEFLKKVDMRPDKAGSENLLLAGVIAPEVIVADKLGNPFIYTTPEGEPSGYGITRNISDYRGTLKIAGRDVTVKAERVVGIADLFQSPDMLGFFAANPQMFFEELGYSFAAQTAVGAIDGHGGNLFAGIYRIENPDPAAIQALRDAGEHVLQYPNGDYALFKIARIDTDDSAGTYWAAPAAGGGFDFRQLSEWLGQQHVFPKLLASLARSMNEQELRNCGPYEFMVAPNHVAAYKGLGFEVATDQFGRGHIVTYNPQQAAYLRTQNAAQIRAPSREPMFVSPRQVSRMVFGNNRDGPFYNGLKRWSDTIGKDPSFRSGLKSNFKWNEGEPAGVSSFFPTFEMKGELARDGITFNNLPNNGEARLPVYFKDGRTKMMADYEKVDGISAWPGDVQKLFPQDKEVYVVEIPKDRASSIRGVFRSGSKFIAVFGDRAIIPPDLRGREKAAVRHGDSVRAEPGFGDAVSIGVQKLGPVRVLDYIMADPMGHFTKQFGDVQFIYEANEYQLEQDLLANPAADLAKRWEFLSHRIPPGFGPDKLPH